jgi:hypothetical protein
MAAMYKTSLPGCLRPLLPIAAAQIHSRRIFTHVHLKGAGSYNGDFIVSKLSPLVNRWAL